MTIAIINKTGRKTAIPLLLSFLFMAYLIISSTLKVLIALHELHSPALF